MFCKIWHSFAQAKLFNIFVSLSFLCIKFVTSNMQGSKDTEDSLETKTK